MKISAIPVVDLFAGPGGLSEGFNQLGVHKGSRFHTRLSIEKDAVACQTLQLRKLIQQFETPPLEYFDFLKGQLSKDQLFSTFPKHGTAALQQVWNAELGQVPQASVSRKVREAIGRSSNWVLLGGPPCQAYSLAGRARMKSTRVDFERDERHFLYREYLRIVAQHRPSVFVFENVKGLLSSTAGGTRMFHKILEDLAAPNIALGNRNGSTLRYKLYSLGSGARQIVFEHGGKTDSSRDFLLLSEQYGIPQARHRLIIVGVRSDIEGAPEPLELTSTVDAYHVLDDLPEIRSRLSQEQDSLDGWKDAISSIQNYAWMQEAGNRAISQEVRRVVSRIHGLQLMPGGGFTSHSGKPSMLSSWYRSGMKGISGHDSRSHMRTDLHRYLYAACHLRITDKSPRLRDFPRELYPFHKNVRQALSGSMFGDRFRVQAPDRPSSTITSHIAKDGHYFIHYAPEQCRSLTLREAARLQTFPDNYFFCGNRTEQYHQVGNAVPPLLSRAIAHTVMDVVMTCRSK